ncbi:hypothetical protein MauCBS54593_006533 [Microsporum audouinii]
MINVKSTITLPAKPPKGTLRPVQNFNDMFDLARTIVVHYGQQMHDGTCIVDPHNPVVDHQLGTDPSSSLFYKRCDGSYRNAIGQTIRSGLVPRIR